MVVESWDENHAGNLAHCGNLQSSYPRNVVYGAMIKAVVDRFEGKYAVLILGKGERQLGVLKDLLPKQAKEGSWLQVEIENESLLSAVLDEVETNNAKQRIAEKLERLRRGDHLKK
jgi:predicted DNA-binding antitoxin AbrB/MazE fold protein